MKKPHYAWIICASATLVMICTMGFCATLLSAYLPYITATGISDSVGSLMISLRSLATLLTIVFVSQYYNVFSLRIGIFLALMLCATSMVVFSIGESAIVYLIASGIAGVGYGLGGSIPVSTLIGAWFKVRRGTALGICSAGSGIATICFPFVVDRLVSIFDLRIMFLCAAVFIVISAIVIYTLIRNNPEEKGLTMYDRGADKEVKPISTDTYLSPTGWILLIVLMTCQGGYSPGVSYLSVLMTTSGYSTTTAASFLSLFGLFVILGKFVFGAAVDFIGARWTTTISYFMALFACITSQFMNGQSLWPCVLTMLLLGPGSSPNSVGIAMLAADFSSPETYRKTMKWMEIAAILGSILIGIVPGAYYDIFGNYQGSYLIMAFFAAISIPLLWLLYKCTQSKP